MRHYVLGWIFGSFGDGALGYFIVVLHKLFEFDRLWWGLVFAAQDPLAVVRLMRGSLWRICLVNVVLVLRGQTVDLLVDQGGEGRIAAWEGDFG